MSKAELLRLVEETGFIFQGRVTRHGTPKIDLAVAAGKSVTVEIEKIFLSTDVLRGLAGKEAIVVTEHAAEIKDETGLLFFTNCLDLGDQLVVREAGHVEASREAVEETAELLKSAAERPLRQRVTSAELIISGKVIDSSAAQKRSIPESEHDPDWWIARVAVQSVVKGKVAKNRKASPEIEVLFANSTDIAWYKAPKLHTGARGIFVLRHAKPKEAPPEVARPIYQAIDPLDFLPSERLHDIKHYLEQERGER